MEERTRKPPSPQVQAFLVELGDAQEDQFVSPPGLGGTWRAKHIRRGLETGALEIHWTGWGLCVMQPSKHVGLCVECARSRGAVCTHCNCAMCAWFRLTDERNSPPVTKARFDELVARLKAFQITGKPKHDDLFEDVG